MNETVNSSKKSFESRPESVDSPNVFEINAKHLQALNNYTEFLREIESNSLAVKV